MSRYRPDGWTEEYLPAEARREVLRDYGEEWHLDVLIETGTHTGDTPAALTDAFDRIYTIEIDLATHEAACQRFAGTNVTCLLGDSTDVLPDVLDLLDDSPALFWLDGHASGGPRGAKDTPIVEELAAIFATDVPHVVLVDDARLFGGMSGAGEWDWPHINKIRVIAASASYDFAVEDDIIRLVPRS
ncbi:MAG: hypothetical protein V4472_25200 [Pseudomonadota bacterium]